MCSRRARCPRLSQLSVLTGAPIGMGASIPTPPSRQYLTIIRGGIQSFLQCRCGTPKDPNLNQSGRFSIVKRISNMPAAPTVTSRASVTSIIFATSYANSFALISPALESTRVGTRDLLIPCGFSNAAPGRRQSIQWQALPYTTPTFSHNQTSTFRNQVTGRQMHTTPETKAMLSSILIAEIFCPLFAPLDQF